METIWKFNGVLPIFLKHTHNAVHNSTISEEILQIRIKARSILQNMMKNNKPLPTYTLFLCVYVVGK